ncbi:MAG: dephospho-CoA kinase [Clostridiales bacterium]|nr:dephospho-CoA kinase [Clostridiales bacterium]
MSGRCFKTIGLTGGIGSGKSTASAYLAEKGYAVLDADKIAREVAEPGSQALGRLASFFGSGILNPDGTLDRKKLAVEAFSDNDKKKRLDEIMHGAILGIMNDRVDGLAKSGYDGIVFLDVPLLFETDKSLMPEMDEIWVIEASAEARLRRAAERDGVSRDHVKMIMDNQAGSEERRQGADIVIDNSGSIEELYGKLDELVNKRKRL